MSLTQDIANMVQAANNLTGEVAGKMGQIDNRMDQAEQDLANWKATTSYVQKYSIPSIESTGIESQKNTGHYTLARLYTITDAYANINPWIHMGWTGTNVVGSGQFCSLTQSHAGYTGQSAMFVKRGAGDVRFFIDRTNQNSAPVYVAVRNTSYNNASCGVKIASYMALSIDVVGAVDLDAWLLDHPNVVEIDLIDITTQPTGA